MAQRIVVAFGTVDQRTQLPSFDQAVSQTARSNQGFERRLRAGLAGKVTRSQGEQSKIQGRFHGVPSPADTVISVAEGT